MKMRYALALLPLASAGAADHYYVEAGYVQGEIGNNQPATFAGWELRGSRTFGDWRLFAGYENSASDTARVAGDLGPEEVSFSKTAFQAGGGYRFALHDRIGLTPSLGVFRTETTSDRSGPGGAGTSETADITRYFVNLGLRAGLADALDLEFNRCLVTTDRSTTWRMDLRYQFTPDFAASISHRTADNVDALSVSLRWRY